MLFVSCSSKPAIVLNETFDGKEILVKTGDLFEVRLEAQLGTGYSWNNQKLSEIITQEGKPSQEKKDHDKVGGFDYQIFRFKAVKPGTDDLVFIYDKSWEKDKSISKKIIFKIIVR